jgi:hypothetical protein
LLYSISKNAILVRVIKVPLVNSRLFNVDNFAVIKFEKTGQDITVPKYTKVLVKETMQYRLLITKGINFAVIIKKSAALRQR